MRVSQHEGSSSCCVRAHAGVTRGQIIDEMIRLHLAGEAFAPDQPTQHHCWMIHDEKISPVCGEKLLPYFTFTDELKLLTVKTEAQTRGDTADILLRKALEHKSST